MNSNWICSMVAPLLVPHMYFENPDHYREVLLLLAGTLFGEWNPGNRNPVILNRLKTTECLSGHMLGLSGEERLLRFKPLLDVYMTLMREHVEESMRRIEEKVRSY